MSAFAELATPQEALEAGADQVLDNLAPSDRVIASIRKLGRERSSGISSTT